MPKAASTFAALLLGALACAPLHAQVLYKWLDAQGRTQYSDQPPKNFKGEVTRIEPDVPASPARVAPAPAAPAAVGTAPGTAEPEVQAPADYLTKRRATRNTLEARVKAARANLEAARKALEDGGETEPDERQIIQRQMQAGQGGMHGQSQQRSNCRATKDVNGKGVTVCAVAAPNEKYFDRVGKLEEAVKRAQEELDEALEARRRGAD